MPVDKDDSQIAFLKNELEATTQRYCVLEKENEILKQEVANLRAKIIALKAQSIERKSLLRKKLTGTPFDGGSNPTSVLRQKQISHTNTNQEESVTVIDCAHSPPDLLRMEIKSPTVPKPPPTPTTATTTTTSTMERNDRKVLTAPAPPPPPPLPSKLLPGSVNIVRRVPEVMEFYRTITKKQTRTDNKTSSLGIPVTANTRNMIGEIENRSTYLLAIKSDVETHGEHIRFLTKEVENAAFTEISDMEKFVKWLDLELSYLVDERAVLKHFPQWPERKADAMREAAFTYRDLKSLEAEVLSFKDNPKQLSILSLKKMQALQDRLEGSVQNIQRMRESVSQKYREFQIPWKWMLDTGVINQLKLSSLKLAKEYMKRVTVELQCQSSKKEDLMLQGVRFAFRVHQFAGGFNTEALHSFEELKAATMMETRQPNTNKSTPKST